MEKTKLIFGQQSMVFTVKDRADHQLDAYEASRDAEALTEPDMLSNAEQIAAYEAEKIAAELN